MGADTMAERIELLKEIRDIMNSDAFDPTDSNAAIDLIERMIREEEQ